jgi:hypothetical protein
MGVSRREYDGRTTFKYKCTLLKSTIKYSIAFIEVLPVNSKIRDGTNNNKRLQMNRRNEISVTNQYINY